MVNDLYDLLAGMVEASRSDADGYVLVQVVDHRWDAWAISAAIHVEDSDQVHVLRASRVEELASAPEDEGE